MEAMSVTMISYGTSLDTESVYGKSLIKAGAAHDKLALEQLNFVCLLSFICNASFFNPLANTYDE
jgi:hypothetical protein